MHSAHAEGSFQISIASDPAEVQRIQEEVEGRLRLYHFDDRDIFSIRLALEEALVNAIKHGNQLDRSKQVHIDCLVREDRFQIGIVDEGPGFNPEDVPDPLAEENLERACGRGLLLIRHYMTEVVYHAPGNRLTMSKVRKPAEPYLNGHCNGHVNGNGNGKH